MSTKDFELIAAILKRNMPVPIEGSTETRDRQYRFERVYWVYLCEQFANGLVTTNDRFDRSRFLSACGLDQYGLEGMES